MCASRTRRFTGTMIVEIVRNIFSFCNVAREHLMFFFFFFIARGSTNLFLNRYAVRPPQRGHLLSIYLRVHVL
jgi:hypothetical protein